MIYPATGGRSVLVSQSRTVHVHTEMIYPATGGQSVLVSQSRTVHVHTQRDDIPGYWGSVRPGLTE